MLLKKVNTIIEFLVQGWPLTVKGVIDEELHRLVTKLILLKNRKR